MKIHCGSLPSLFSWRPPNAKKALIALLALFARSFFPVQATSTNLVGRCSQGVCLFPQVADLAKDFFHTQRDSEPCFELKSLEEGIQENFRKLLPDKPSDESGKAKNLEKIAPWQSLLEMEIPPFEVRLIHSFLEQKVPAFFTHWNALKELPAIQLDDPQVKNHLAGIDRAIKKAFASPEGFEIPEIPGPFIVRSNWIEDLGNVTNAGMHYSPPNIPLKKLPPAVATALRSYFCRESLQNLLRTGINPFAHPPPLSVILQQYIAEDQAGIPTSFVLFTNEPLYVGGEGWRFLRISSTWGPGAVESGVGTDTTFCLPSQAYPELYCLTAIENKPVRWAPAEEGGLKEVQNSKKLAESSSLSRDQIEGLYWRGILLEVLLGGPTDAEGLYKNKFFLVQARPIHRGEPLPKYLLKHPEAMQRTFQLKSIVLGKGAGSVIVITSPEQLLITHTLEDADRRVDQYQGVQLVIAAECPPENAHAVINLGEREIAALCPLNLELENIDPKVPLVASMQNGTLTFWNTSIAPLEEYVQDGYAVHPAPLAISLPVPHGLVKTPPEPSFDFEALVQRGDLKELEAHFQAFRQQKAALEQTIENPSPPMQQRLDALNALEEGLSRAFEEAYASQKAPPLLALFFLKVLQTLFRRSPFSILSQYSLLDAPALFKDIETLRDYQKQLAHKPHFAELLLFGKQTPSPEAFTAWRENLLRFEALAEQGLLSPEKIGQFKTFVENLEKSGVLPLWLLFSQPKDASLQALLDQISPSEQSLFDDLLQAKENLRQFSFSRRFDTDPETAWKELRTLLQPLLFPPLLRQIQASPLPFLDPLRVGIEALDGAIRIVKVSNDPAKFALFEEMTRFFLELLRSWVRDLIPKEALPRTADERWSLDGYLAKKIRFPQMAPSQLFPSASFNVAAALFGISIPGNWHDFWTFFHQECHKVLSILQRLKLPIENSLLPQKMKEAIAEIEQTNWGRTVHRIGVEVTEQKIVVSEHVPLYGHSGELILTCDASGECTMDANFYGLDELRASKIDLWVEALREAGIFQWERFYSSSEEMSFSFSVAQNLPSFLKEYAAMAASTVGQSLAELLVHLLERRKESQTKLVDYFLKIAMADLENNLLGRGFEILEALFKKGKDPEVAKQIGLFLWKGKIDGEQLHNRIGEITSVLNNEQLGSSIFISLILEEEAASTLWKGILSAESPYQSATKIAEILTKSKHAQQTGFQLLTHLVKESKGYQGAISAAERGMKSDHWYIQIAAYHLLEALFEKEQGFETALEIGKMHNTIREPLFKEVSLNLLKLLVGHHKGHEIAIAAAAEALEEENPQVRGAALELWKALFKEEVGYEMAEEKAKNLTESSDGIKKISGLELFKELASRGYGSEAARKAAAANIHISYLQQTCSELLEILN